MAVNVSRWASAAYNRPALGTFRHMTRKNSANATRVYLDPTVVELVDTTAPAGVSRTGWVNYLIQQGLKKVGDNSSAKA